MTWSTKFRKTNSSSTYHHWWQRTTQQFQRWRGQLSCLATSGSRSASTFPPDSSLQAQDDHTPSVRENMPCLIQNNIHGMNSSLNDTLATSKHFRNSTNALFKFFNEWFDLYMKSYPFTVNVRDKWTKQFKFQMLKVTRRQRNSVQTKSSSLAQG